MLRVRLSALLGERRLRIADVARDTGINRGTLTRMYYESAERIEIEVLERLCSYLGCEIGDLLRIEPTHDGLSKRRDCASAVEPLAPAHMAGEQRPSPS